MYERTGPHQLPHTLKVVKIGNSSGVILPKEVLAKLGVGLGDMVDIVEGPDGLSFKRHDTGFAAQMTAARAVMERRREALRELAKQRVSWIWVERAVAIAAHAEQLAEQLAEHGGAAGVRDMNMLESAMARPRNLVAYGEPDVAELAASYAFGIARTPPFCRWQQADSGGRQRNLSCPQRSCAGVQRRRTGRDVPVAGSG